ncbi:MAG TPA: GTP cyclohydrolase, FolE2/MptA family [Candidatus Bilamarchaeaceae archaeon]|nr:GTP cyclohydrolase, FolE2/MptA family [Candidatus Bilamarchaeaceae archaeon]
MQDHEPENMIKLNRVGVTDLEYPITIVRDSENYKVIVKLEMSVDLPENLKGVHVRNFVEDLEIPRKTAAVEVLAKEIALSLLKKHKHAKNVHVKLATKLGYGKGKVANLFGLYEIKDNKESQMVGVSVRGNSTCPCSVESTTNGNSHNQRAKILLFIESSNDVDAADLCKIAEKSFSSPLFLSLNKEQEKGIIEDMHKNPRFIEDIVRWCVVNLRSNFTGRYAKIHGIAYESLNPFNLFSEWEGIL